MGRRLRRTVVAGGVKYLAGTAETAELAGLVSNPAAWEGESDNEPPHPPPSEVAGDPETSDPAPAPEPEPSARRGRKATGKR